MTTDLIKGHIVVIGTTAEGLKEFRPTPLDPAAAGVEIGRLDRVQPARVTDGLVPLWLKCLEPLIAELTLRTRLGERQSVYGIPPLAIRKGLSPSWRVLNPG